MALAIVASGWILLTGGTISLGGGCAYEDGLQYCAMATGGHAISPWNRRILVPELVRLLDHGPLVARFRLIAVLSTVGTAVGAAVLAGRVAAAAGARPRRRRGASIATGAIVVLMPHSLHLAAYIPVLTDYAATCLGVWWLVALSSRSRHVRNAGVVLAAATVLTREAWALPIVLVALLLVIRARGADRRLGWATLLAAAGALATVLLQPALGDEPSSVAAASHWLHDHFGSLDGAVALGWALLLPFGALPLLLLQRRRPRDRTALPRTPDLLTTGATLVIAGHVVMAMTGGSDVMRIVAPAAPVAVALGIGSVAVGPSALDPCTAAVTVMSVLVWRPFHVLRGGDGDFLRLFAPQDVPGAVGAEMTGDAYLIALPLTVWVLLLLRLRRSQSKRRAGAGIPDAVGLRSAAPGGGPTGG